MTSLKGRSFLTLLDYSPGEIRALVDRGLELKAERRRGDRKRRLEGYSIALLFEKRSTRTRSAFETAFGEEGGHASFLSTQDVHLGTKEDIQDTARVLGRMFDCIQFRGFKQEYVQALADHSGVPVYNGLTDLYHPTQVLADLMSLAEGASTDAGGLAGASMAYVGDGRNNVARSLAIGCAKLGVAFTIGAPVDLQPSTAEIDQLSALANEHGTSFTVTDDPAASVAGALAVYTDVWASMGEEDLFAERKPLLEPFRVNASLMAATGRPESIFLHCLPAQKGNEVTEEVFESEASKVFDQAENRKHSIKALILETLGLL